MANSTFALQGMIDKFVNVSSETSMMHKNEIDTIKKITGGDGISIDRKNLTAVDGTLRAKLIIQSNEAPRFKDKSQG